MDTKGANSLRGYTIGVAIVPYLPKLQQRRFIEIFQKLKSVSERIITAKYNSVFAKLTAVVCHAPTDLEDAENDEKLSLYSITAR